MEIVETVVRVLAHGRRLQGEPEHPLGVVVVVAAAAGGEAPLEEAGGVVGRGENDGSGDLM